MGVLSLLLLQLGSVLLPLAVQQTVAVYNQQWGCFQQGNPIPCQTLPRFKRIFTEQDCIEANCCFDYNKRPRCYEKVGSSPYFNEHVTVPPNAGNPLAGTFLQSGGEPGYPGNMLVKKCPIGLYPKQPCTYDYPYPTKQQCKKWYCCWDYYYARCFKAKFHITKLRKRCPPGTKNPPRCDGCDAPPGLPEYGLTGPTISTIQSQAGPPYIMGTKASYTCKSGYYLDPKNGILTCDASANWSPPQIRCKPGCEEPPERPDNGLTGPVISTTQAHTGAPYIYSTTATYKCADGYYAEPENGVLTCDTSANWSPSEIKCILGCGIPLEQPANGASGPVISTEQTIDGPPYFVGSSAMYTCTANQYFPDPMSGKLYCKESGMWDPTDITCIRGCEDPGTPSDGQATVFDPSGQPGPRYKPGTVASFSCMGNRFLCPDVFESTCIVKADGMTADWDPEPPTICAPGCENPRSETHFVSGPTINPPQSNAPYSPESTAKYTCKRPGHVIRPPGGTLTCGKDAWDPEKVFCSKGCAKPPRTIRNGQLVKIDSPETSAPYGFGSTAMYKCKPGYRFFFRNSKRICTPLGLWSPVLCKRNRG